MRRKVQPQLALRLVAVLLVAILGGGSVAPAQTTAPGAPTGLVRLRVRPKVGGKEKGLARKRFYLIRGGLEDNKALVEKIALHPAFNSECYYRSINASEALIKWLQENDCESVYCRAIDLDSVTGAAAVPEFKLAFERAPKLYNTPELKLNWLTTLLPDNVRDGFYRQKQLAIKSLVAAAETATGAPVISVMTDRNGTAYFTELAPGTYTITNLLPTVVGTTSILWNCEVKVKPGDLATEKPFLISNAKSPQVKCVGVEAPLPACPANPAAGPAK